jgi:hypothetical protein
MLPAEPPHRIRWQILCAAALGCGGPSVCGNNASLSDAVLGAAGGLSYSYGNVGGLSPTGRSTGGRTHRPRRGAIAGGTGDGARHVCRSAPATGRGPPDCRSGTAVINMEAPFLPHGLRVAAAHFDHGSGLHHPDQGKRGSKLSFAVGRANGTSGTNSESAGERQYGLIADFSDACLCGNHVT